MPTQQTIREQIKNVIKEIYHDWAGYDSVAEGYYNDKIQIKVTAIMNIFWSELELWKIFAEVKGCKKDKEDCSFKRCSHWAECDLLITALSDKFGKGER